VKIKIFKVFFRSTLLSFFRRNKSGYDAYNFLTKRAGELRFLAFERGSLGTEPLVKIKMFESISKPTLAKQSWKDR
jgi:hypothetical protein